MPEPVSVADPGAVVKAYARLLEERGGRFVQGDARTLAPLRSGWQVRTAEGPVAGNAVVVALGPWSDDLFRPLGLRLPFGVKRGYHMHFKPQGNATLNRPIVDIENGYALTPMVKGIRLTTGAEFALRDAPAEPGAARPRRASGARDLPAGRARRRRALVGAPPLSAGHAADRRPRSKARGAVAQFRPPPLRVHAGASYRAAADRNDDGGDALHRSGALSRGAVLV